MRRKLIYLLGRLPVKVLRGLARGAWWSVYPCSAYWRLGGNDPALERILRLHACRPGLVCWDLGAHHGIYSVGLARAVGPGGRVEAFEPDPVSHSRLVWHRRLNRLSQLHPHAVAASARTGTARIYQYDGFGATSSHLPYPGESLDAVCFQEIRTVRLDEWVDGGRILPPAFVKIDVEGHAVPALEGMHATLSRHRPVLVVGIHSAEEHEGVRAILTPLGYDLCPASPESAEGLATRHFGELLCQPGAR